MDTDIRLARPDDAAAIAAIYRPSVVGSPVSFELEPPDADEMAARVSRTLAAHPWLVCTFDGAVAGYAYGGVHRARAAYRWAVETSVYVSGAHRRQGVARALYASLLAVLHAQGFGAAYAGITLPNPASVGFHEDAGFTPVGVFHRVGYKLGRWHDVGWWERPLSDPPDDPAEPIAVSRLVDEARWSSLLRVGLPFLRASEGS